MKLLTLQNYNRILPKNRRYIKTRRPFSIFRRSIAIEKKKLQQIKKFIFRNYFKNVQKQSKKTIRGQNIKSLSLETIKVGISKDSLKDLHTAMKKTL